MLFKKTFIILSASLLSLTLSAQDGALPIEKISIINYGDGRLLFTDLDMETPLEGQHRIIDGVHSMYILANFKDGFFDGRYEEFINNKLAGEGYYTEGMPNGVFKEYDRNGVLTAENNYKDGELDGIAKEYYQDGSLKVEKNFKDGKLDGVYRQYNTRGEIELDKGYKAGAEHGPEKRYNSEGELVFDHNYNEGRQHGRQFWNMESNRGRFIRIEHYDNGVRTGEYSETEDGVLRLSGSYKGGKKDGLWKYVRKNGTPEKDETYKDGALDGPTTFYYTDGSVEKELTYKGGKLNGLSKNYYWDTGELKNEFTYVDGKKEGPYKLYYDDGKLKEEGRCEGDREVFRKEYHQNGNVKSVKQRTRTGWENVEQ